MAGNNERQVQGCKKLSRCFALMNPNLKKQHNEANVIFLLTLRWFFTFGFTSTKDQLSFLHAVTSTGLDFVSFLFILANSDSCRLWLLALMTIPQVVTKQLSAHFFAHIYALLRWFF